MELTAIKENPDNPRFITDEKFKQLVDSIRDFPEMLELRPLVIDENNMTLGGNMRLKALKELGHKTIPAKWIKKASDLTAKQKNEFIIKDNVGFGEWDWVMFGQDYWKGTDVGEWGLDIPENVTIEEPIEDNFDPGPIDQIETDIRPGDIIQMGPHRLMCGDATNPEHWKKLMAGRRADLIVTDPPYNVDYQGGNGMKIMNDKQTSARFYRFLLDFHKALYNHTKPGGGWYEFHADSEGRNFRNAFEESGLMMKQCLVWVKNTLVMGRQDYHWKHEPILYGWKPGAAHYFIDDRTNNTVIRRSGEFQSHEKGRAPGLHFNNYPAAQHGDPRRQADQE